MFSNTYGVVLCFCFVFLGLVWPVLPVSLDCPFVLPLRSSLKSIPSSKGASHKLDPPVLGENMKFAILFFLWGQCCSYF